MKKLISESKKIYKIINDSHMQAHSDITDELIAEAIEKIDYVPPFTMVTVDLGRIIGFDHCVKTTDSDSIIMKARTGRNTESRIVLNRSAEPTSLMTIGICRDDDGLDTIFTAFAGQKAPKELSDPRLSESERPEAEQFWACHALVED